VGSGAHPRNSSVSFRALLAFAESTRRLPVSPNKKEKIRKKSLSNLWVHQHELVGTIKNVSTRYASHPRIFKAMC
jgi:hypothetical protein